MTTKRKRYSKEFKLEAVRLLEEGKRPPVELARELGIQRNQLYKWQEQLSKNEERPSLVQASASRTKTQRLLV